MKISLDQVMYQIYLIPYIKITHNKWLNGRYEFIIGWLNYQVVISTGEHDDPKIDCPIQETSELTETMYSYDEMRAIAYKAYCVGQLDEPTEGKFNSWIHQFKK